MSAKIDRQALHDMLWEKADRVGKVEIYQTGLAEELGITKPTMSLIIKELTDDGRIRKLFARKANVGVYKVSDPAQFEHEYVPTKSGLVEVCQRCGLMEKVGPHIARVGR